MIIDNSVLGSLRSSIKNHAFHMSSDNAQLITKQGGSYAWLFDLRNVFLRRTELECMADAFWETYSDLENFQVAGLEMAAIPLLAAVMLKAPSERGEVNGLIIRKNRKPTGMGNAIEGRILDMPVVLIDDSLNSGSSAEKARSVLSMHGCELREMFVVVDFESHQGVSWRKRNGVSVRSLFTLEDFDVPPIQGRRYPTQTYRELWRTVTPGGFPFHIVPKSAPLLVGGRIFRGCDAAKMQAFSAETGGLIWEYQATGAAYTKKGIWSCPSYHDGKIYFGAYNGSIYCLDADTGNEVWVRAEGEWVGASPLVVPKHNLVYFGIEYLRPWAKGSIGAYDLLTGEKIWEHQVQKLQHGSPGYWRDGDLVVWGSADHEMLALDARSGEVRWRYATRRSVKYAPAVDEERKLVAFASFDKSIYILDVETGDRRGEWVTDEICYTTPLFAKNKLFCGSGDRFVYVIDVDEMVVLKKINLGARIYSSPVFFGNRVIVGSNGGRVVEIDVDTLEIVGDMQLPDAVTNAVALSPDGKNMYVSTYMNHLYAFERLGTGL